MINKSIYIYNYVSTEESLLSDIVDIYYFDI